MLFGDKGYSSIEELYADNEKLIYAFIRDHTENETAIAELVQIIWYKILTNYDKIPTTSSKKTKDYIRAMAHNAVVDYFDAEKRREELFDELTYFFKEEADETVETELVEFCNRELEDYLHEAMGTLSETEKYLIKLRFYERMTSPAIGELMGMSDGVVRMTILRILKKLRKEIETMQRRDEHGR